MDGRMTMRAAGADRYGPPEVLSVRELPKPGPKSNEVLIRVRASLATPPDCAFRKGEPVMVRLFTGVLRPKVAIQGGFLAGDVEAVGAAVTKFKPGDRVYGEAATDFGTYAEYKCMPEDGTLAVIPQTLGYEDAVALIDGYLTARPFLHDHGKLAAGQSILIIGAAGSIGGAAVQLARHAGAIVTGTCSDANAELVRSLGADRVVDYRTEDATAASEAYDVIFDAVGKSSFRTCERALKPGGVYLTTVPALAAMVATMTTRNKPKRGLFAATGLRPTPNKIADLETLAGLIAARAFRPVIDRTYPLAEIAAAQRYVETGHKHGSVVIAI